jgi:hypothetical protein
LGKNTLQYILWGESKIKYLSTSNDSNSSNLKFQRSYQNFTMYPCLLLNEPLLSESCCKCSFLCMESDIRLSNYTHLLPSHWTSYVKKKLYIIHNQWISILSLILPIIYIGGCFSQKISLQREEGRTPIIIPSEYAPEECWLVSSFRRATVLLQLVQQVDKTISVL